MGRRPRQCFDSGSGSPQRSSENDIRRLTFHLPGSVTGDVGQRREMMPLGDVLRRALDRDERLDGFDFGKHIEAIEALPEGAPGLFNALEYGGG